MESAFKPKQPVSAVAVLTSEYLRQFRRLHLLSCACCTVCFCWLW